MMNIYFAGPLFNDADRDYNAKVVKILRDCGYDVYLPQETGIIADMDTASPAMKREIFGKDLAYLMVADAVVVNTNGTDVDSGTAVEIGIAYMKQKPIILLNTECRGRLNNMILQVMTYETRSIKELVKYLSDKVEPLFSK